MDGGSGKGRMMLNERGDVAAWSLILLMTAALVIAIWSVASERLIEIVTSALTSICGSLGC